MDTCIEVTVPYQLEIIKSSLRSNYSASEVFLTTDMCTDTYESVSVTMEYGRPSTTEDSRVSTDDVENSPSVSMGYRPHQTEGGTVTTVDQSS